jgi:hypothetical protein
MLSKSERLAKTRWISKKLGEIIGTEKKKVVADLFSRLEIRAKVEKELFFKI